MQLSTRIAFAEIGDLQISKSNRNVLFIIILDVPGAFDTVDHVSF